MNDSSVLQTFKTLDQSVLMDADQAFPTLTYPRGGGCRAAVPTTSPSEVTFKEHRFCRRNDIKSFRRFTLQPKSATEIGRGHIAILKNIIKNSQYDFLQF